MIIDLLTLNNQQLQAADQENTRLRSLLGMKDRECCRVPMDWRRRDLPASHALV